MKIVWHNEKKDCVDLVAETPAEVAFCDIIAVDVEGHRYEMKKQGWLIIQAKYSVIPDEPI